MESIASKDGTGIGFARSGTGPPLVLVHGTSADHTRWKPLLRELEVHFTVHAVDRRGRGGSGDTADYSVEREFEHGTTWFRLSFAKSCTRPKRSSTRWRPCMLRCPTLVWP